MIRGKTSDRPFTVADLEAMPDDSNRYELIDGTLMVTSSVGFRHQQTVARLVMLLGNVCPPGMRVLPAPFPVRPNETNEVLPDVLVTRDEDVTAECLPVAPLLAVEVISPSSETLDLYGKKAIYQRMGVPSYWVIDPERPSLTVFELDKGGFTYQQVVEVTADGSFEATQPFAVRVVPTELLD